MDNQQSNIGFRIARSASDNLFGFAYVPAGTFWMGDSLHIGQADEQPVHQVTLDAFYICRHEVTQEQYLAVMGSNPSSFHGSTPTTCGEYHLVRCRELL